MNDAIAIALPLVRSSEGCKLTAYQDVAGVWTIGYGHTGPEVVEGLVWTQDQAEAALLADLGHAHDQVLALCPLLAGHPAKLAAICDWTFNLGSARLRTSTLRRVINASAWELVPAELMKWVYAGGTTQPGLIKRRSAECDLWRRVDGDKGSASTSAV